MTVISRERRSKILFIQHAGALGGSANSLLLLMRELASRGFKTEVALIRTTPVLHRLYADFKVYTAPKIEIFAHTTGGWARPGSWASLWQFGRTICRWKTAQQATLQLLAEAKPDIVHLNSVVLSPSAIALLQGRIPFVWHVRECPPSQGYRTRFLRSQLATSPHVIFLSPYDQHEWVGASHGQVIPNFVDFSKINDTPDREEARRQLGIDSQRPVVLYLGGTTSIKGFSVLLNAVPHVLDKQPDALFLMPNAEIIPASAGLKKILQSVLPLIGFGTPGQRVFRQIEHLGIRKAIHLLPFAEDVAPYLSACDLLVVPSIQPHFSRPTIEAMAMGRPVVGSDIGGVEHLIEPERTGLLVPPGDSLSLAAAVSRVIADPNMASEMGENGRMIALRKYSAEHHIDQIIHVYDQLLTRRCVQ